MWSLCPPPPFHMQVNASGNVLLDTFVSQKESVSDYRTWVSGVTPQHLMGAPSLEEVQKQVCLCVCGGGGWQRKHVYFFVGYQGGGLPQAGHTQSNQANPTARGPRQSLTRKRYA